MKWKQLVLSISIMGFLANSVYAQQNQTDPKANDNQNKGSETLRGPKDTKVLGRTTTTAVEIGEPFLAIKASSLMGHEIENARGKEIGDINNLLIDLPRSHVAGVVVGVGGVLGIGEQNRIVPLNAILCKDENHAPYRAKDLSSTIPADKAKSADREAKDDRETDRKDESVDTASKRQAIAYGRSDDDRDRVLVLAMDENLRTSKIKAEEIKSYNELGNVYREYKQTPYWNNDGESRQRVRQQDDSTAQRANQYQVKKADELLGASIKNSQDDDIGTMEDMVIDLKTGRVIYATVSAGGVLGIGDNIVAVPTSQFSMNADGDLILNTSEERLKKAPQFAADQWPDLNDPTWVSQVYGYYGETEYWSSDPTKASKDNQSNDKSNDRQDQRKEQDRQ